MNPINPATVISGHLTLANPTRVTPQLLLGMLGQIFFLPYDGICDVLGPELLWPFCYCKESWPKDTTNILTEAK